MGASSWSSQQLTEFIAAVSAAETGSAAARAVAERAAETLDAEVAAIVRDDELVVAVGYPEGATPLAELAAVRPGDDDASVEPPGVGRCTAVSVALAHPPGARLVIARRDRLTRAEVGLVRGMARVAEMTMRMLSVLEDERTAREEGERLALEQAALRRVATLVARGEPAHRVLAAVAEEVGRLLPADITLLGRFDSGGTAVNVGGWSRTGDPVEVGARLRLGGYNILTRILETGRPMRMDDYAEGSGDVHVNGRVRGIKAAVGAPIVVEGRLWGVMTVATMRDEPLPCDTEERLSRFTSLVATAIANAQARVELSALADEQAALRRVATLVARGAPPPAVFGAVAEEVARLLPADAALVNRYDADGHATIVGGWSRGGDVALAGARAPIGGQTVSTLVLETGKAARAERVGVSGPVAALWSAGGWRSSVGTPIIVAGHLWGVVLVASTRDEALPPDTEQRLAGFTELAATAIANAEAHAELTASRARIVATADETRRRIERDLHDGLQQRLVSLALQLRAAQAAVPAEVSELSSELDRVAAGLTGALDELREYARGIHPAILSEGGLAPALRTLARRSGVPVELDVRSGVRLPERVEVTAYYVVSEALTNVVRHANASSVRVAADLADGLLHVSVSDDGIGGADPSRGSGLVGLRDRVEALGGKLVLRSQPGKGTSVEATLPVDPA